MRIVIAAAESAGIQVTRSLGAIGHEIVAVLADSAGASASGAGIAAVARSLGVTVWPAERVRDDDLADELLKARVDLFLNVHSLHIVREAVLQAPRLGAFNLHPGPLPEMAGLDVPSWAIYLGRATHAVTVHRMTSALDAGAIAFREDFSIGHAETGISLSLKCIRAGVPLVRRLVDAAAAVPPEIPATPQDLSLRRYFGRRPPLGGWIDWTRGAPPIAAFIRACDYLPFPSPWGHPRTRAGGEPIELLKAVPEGSRCEAPPGSVGPPSGTSARVATGDGWLLVQRVRRGGSAADGAAVLREGLTLDRVGAP